jgi:hypothetical protein
MRPLCERVPAATGVCERDKTIGQQPIEASIDLAGRDVSE